MATKSNRTCLARLPEGELQELSAKDFNTIDGLRKKAEHVVWLDIVSPTADDMKLLREEFAVHPLALEDLEKRRQRPKLDTYAEQQIIVTYEVLEPSAAGSSLRARRAPPFRRARLPGQRPVAGIARHQGG